MLPVFRKNKTPVVLAPMAGISDYPTWRFGLVQLLPGSETERTGLE